MQKLALALAAVLVFAGGAYCQRTVNACKSTRLTSASVLVSCNDEREPHVSKIDETATAVVVSCQK